MAENIYVGRGKENKYGLSINVCIDDIVEYAKDNLEKSKNGKTYIRLDVSKMKKPDDHKNTHYVKVNTWKPEPKKDESIPW